MEAPLALYHPPTRWPSQRRQEIRQLIPRASSASANTFRRIASSAGTLKLSQFDNQSLTLVLLLTDLTKHKAPRPHLRWVVTNGPAKPNALAMELAREKRLGRLRFYVPNYATFIHADRITKCICTVKGDAASGTGHFRVPDLYEGDVDYLAKRQKGKWHITEFRLPRYGFRVVRDPKGLWKKQELSPKGKE